MGVLAGVRVLRRGRVDPLTLFVAEASAMVGLSFRSLHVLGSEQSDACCGLRYDTHRLGAAAA